MADSNRLIMGKRETVTVKGQCPPGQILRVEGENPVGPTFKPSWYAITSFDIPLSGVPLCTWSADQKDSYTIVDLATKTEATVPLVYVSNSPSDLSTKDIWCYGQYLEMCNNALREAHEQLLKENPKIGPDPVTIRFDPVTCLFTHWLPKVYDHGEGVQLYTTYSVARLFANMGGNNPLAVGYPSSSPKQFRITSQGSAQSGEYNVLTQEFPSLYAWHDLQSIELTVNGRTLTLTDLVSLPSKDRSPFTYAASEPRWLTCSCRANEPIRVEASFTVAKNGNKRILNMNAGDSFRVVFAFSGQ